MALEIVLNMVCSFVGVMLFGALFNVPRKYYLGSGLTGLVGWIWGFILENRMVL